MTNCDVVSLEERGKVVIPAELKKWRYLILGDHFFLSFRSSRAQTDGSGFLFISVT